MSAGFRGRNTSDRNRRRKVRRIETDHRRRASRARSSSASPPNSQPVRPTRSAGFTRGGGAILNRQRAIRVPLRQLEDFLARACSALRLAPESLTICLVTNSEIARWNRTYRHKAGPTDVLSFPAEEEPLSLANRRHSRRASRRSAPYLGDIAIAPAVARSNARRFGRAFSDEMRILILHGMLHLMGYDHETDAGQMDRRERRLRRQLGLA